MPQKSKKGNDILFYTLLRTLENNAKGILFAFANNELFASAKSDGSLAKNHRDTKQKTEGGISMEYEKIETVSKRWGISARRVQILCGEGKIPGAKRFGRAWMIPADAQKPADGRTRGAKKSAVDSEEKPLPRKTPFLYMTNLYDTPGQADAGQEKLKDHREAQMLFAAEVAYSRGEIDKVYESAD